MMNKKLVGILLAGLVVFSGMMMGCKTPNDDDDDYGGGTTVEKFVEDKYLGTWVAEVNDHLIHTLTISKKMISRTMTNQAGTSDKPISSSDITLAWTEGNKLYYSTGTGNLIGTGAHLFGTFTSDTVLSQHGSLTFIKQ
jgi:hypothetical protein